MFSPIKHTIRACWHTAKPPQAEERNITAVSNGGLTLTLSAPLTFAHAARYKTYAGLTTGPVDLRAEVALLSSNVVVTAAEGGAAQVCGGAREQGRGRGKRGGCYLGMAWRKAVQSARACAR